MKEKEKKIEQLLPTDMDGKEKHFEKLLVAVADPELLNSYIELKKELIKTISISNIVMEAQTWKENNRGENKKPIINQKRIKNEKFADGIWLFEQDMDHLIFAWQHLTDNQKITSMMKHELIHQIILEGRAIEVYRRIANRFDITVNRVRDTANELMKDMGEVS